MWRVSSGSEDRFVRLDWGCGFELLAEQLLRELDEDDERGMVGCGVVW